MKQSRRQELKTNDLSVYLQQTWEAIQRNATYLIGGLVVVVLLVVAVMYNRRTAAEASDAAWVTLLGLQQRSALDPSRDLLTDIESAVGAFGNREDVGTRLLELRGQTSLRVASTLGPDADRKERIDLLKQAQSDLESVVSRGKVGPVLVNGARMNLAAVHESLALLGEEADGVEKARELYQKVIAEEDQPYADLAKRLKGVLDEPLKPIELATTRPASATQPASMPASLVETQPAPEETSPAEPPVSEAPPAEENASPAEEETSPTEPEVDSPAPAPADPAGSTDPAPPQPSSE